MLFLFSRIDWKSIELENNLKVTNIKVIRRAIQLFAKSNFNE